MQMFYVVAEKNLTSLQVHSRAGIIFIPGQGR